MNIIKDFLKKENLTIAEAAKFGNLSHSSISKWCAKNFHNRNCSNPNEVMISILNGKIEYLQKELDETKKRAKQKENEIFFASENING